MRPGALAPGCISTDCGSARGTGAAKSFSSRDLPERGGDPGGQRGDPGMSAASAPRPLPPEEGGRRLREAHRVLLVALGPSLAELLSATPVVGNLRRALPGAELVFLAGSGSAPAVFDHPDLNAVFATP